MLLIGQQEQAIWASAYGAYFANQVSERMARGHGGPYTEECIELNFHSEAACVADMAVETSRSLDARSAPELSSSEPL